MTLRSPSADQHFPQGRARSLAMAAALFAACLVVGVLAYAALSVPGPLFPKAQEMHWSARDLVLMRGQGRLQGDELIITAPDASGLVVVSLNAPVRSADYPEITWHAADVPGALDVRVLWSSEYAPQKVNSAVLQVEGGRIRPAPLFREFAWAGRIGGIALAVRGPLVHPLRVQGVTASPLGIGNVLRARFREWFAFEPWSGSSINTLVGGTDIQELPLPLLIASVVLVAAGILALVLRVPALRGRFSLPATVAMLFMCGWLVLDARWALNLARQVAVTADTYGGKPPRERQLAAEDGALYAFVEKARADLPAEPARVFVLADELYFRTRAAYHLYPHSVFAPRPNTVAPREFLRPGDWIFAFQRRGLQYDVTQRLLRWEGGGQVPVEAKIVEPGAGLFQIRSQ